MKLLIISLFTLFWLVLIIVSTSLVLIQDYIIKMKGSQNMTYTNSPLVSYTKLSPNHSGQRTHAINRITPHCVVGQCSVETLGNIFYPNSRQASCQYGIGSDGRVGMYVEEKNRSWCSSSDANDQRAVTIECASDTSEPYTMNNTVYETLIKLCTDICKRNGKRKLLWFADKDKSLNYAPKSDEMIITVHRWFANKSCPGDWLYSRLGDLAEKVTLELGGTNSVNTNSFKTYIVRITSSNGVNIRKGPGTNFDKVGVIPKGGAYTIVSEAKGTGASLWGKLKSGAGWIALDFTEKIR